MKRFLLVSDSGEVDNDLRKSLDSTGAPYELILKSYKEASQIILENKFDRIFCAVCPNGGNVNQQIKVVSLLHKSISTPVSVIVDKSGRPILKHLNQAYPDLESINYTDLRRPGTGHDAAMAQAFGASYADRQAERQRSEMKSRAIAKLEVEIERLKMRCTQLEEESEKHDVFLNGGTMGMGLISMTHGNGKELADLRSDFEKFCKSFEEKRNLSIQKAAIIVGAIATIFGAIIPLVVTEFVIEPNLEPAKAEVRK